MSHRYAIRNLLIRQIEYKKKILAVKKLYNIGLVAIHFYSRLMLKFKLGLFLKIEYFRHGGLKRGDQLLSVNGVRKEKKLLKKR